MRVRQPQTTYRIRRCGGSRDCWVLVMVFDGKESDCAACYTTAPTIDGLLKNMGHRNGLHAVRVPDGATIELVWEGE